MHAIRKARLTDKLRLDRRLARALDHSKRNIYVAPGSYIHPDAVIGRCTNIAYPSHIGPCSIGSFCAIGGRLVVRASNHSMNYANMQALAQRAIIGSSLPVSGEVPGPTKIGHACWVGDSVVVLPGVTIGSGAVIGAGSVVTKPVPPFGIAVGNPARVVRRRFDEEVVAYLLGTAWWEWSLERIRRNTMFFEIDFTRVSRLDLESIEILD